MAAPSKQTITVVLRPKAETTTPKHDTSALSGPALASMARIRAVLANPHLMGLTRTDQSAGQSAAHPAGHPAGLASMLDDDLGNWYMGHSQAGRNHTEASNYTATEVTGDLDNKRCRDALFITTGTGQHVHGETYEVEFEPSKLSRSHNTSLVVHSADSPVAMSEEETWSPVNVDTESELNHVGSWAPNQADIEQPWP